MARFLAFIVVILGIFLNTGIAYGQSFRDVPSTHPFATAIEYVKDQGIVQGYADGTFRPNQKVNRAELLKILMEANYTGPFERSGCFSDVHNEWFAPYICEAYIRRIIAGYSDTTFRPANTIVFSEAAKMLTQSFTCDQNNNKVPKDHRFGLLSFSSNVRYIVHDFGCPVGNDSSKPWYYIYVEGLSGVHAIPTTITRFDQEMTRGELAEIIYRIRSRALHKSSATYQSILEQNPALSYTGYTVKPFTEKELTGMWEISTSRGAMAMHVSIIKEGNSLRMGDFGLLSIQGHSIAGTLHLPKHITDEGVSSLVEVLIERVPNSSTLQFWTKLPNRRWENNFSMQQTSKDVYPTEQVFTPSEEYTTMLEVVSGLWNLKTTMEALIKDLGYAPTTLATLSCIDSYAPFWDNLQEYYSGSYSIPMIPENLRKYTHCQEGTGYYYQSFASDTNIAAQFIIGAPTFPQSPIAPNARLEDLQGLHTVADLEAYCASTKKMSLDMYIVLGGASPGEENVCK